MNYIEEYYNDLEDEEIRMFEDEMLALTIR